MAEKNILPWKRDKQIEALRGRTFNDPFLAMREEMNRMFDSFFTRTPGSLLADWEGMQGSFLPHVDVSETDKEVKVTAEIPGVTEKEIDLTLDHNVLSIKGHKEAKKEEKERHYYRLERTYGSFQRDVLLPDEVDENKIEASFKDGVLEVVLPKKEDAIRTAKKVKINTK